MRAKGKQERRPWTAEKSGREQAAPVGTRSCSRVGGGALRGSLSLSSAAGQGFFCQPSTRRRMKGCFTTVVLRLCSAEPMHTQRWSKDSDKRRLRPIVASNTLSVQVHFESWALSDRGAPSSRRLHSSSCRLRHTAAWSNDWTDEDALQVTQRKYRLEIQSDGAEDHSGSLPPGARVALGGASCLKQRAGSNCPNSLAERLRRGSFQVTGHTGKTSSK